MKIIDPTDINLKAKIRWILCLISFFLSVYPAAAGEVASVGGDAGRDGGNTAESISALPAAELEKNRKLIEKAIGDLESFRVMTRHIKEHKDDTNRILLAEEAGRYIDKHVNPLLGDHLMYVKETFGLIVALKFFKAYLYFEMGDYGRYEKTVKKMEEKYGREHLGVSLQHFNSDFRSIGEALLALNEKVRKASSPPPAY